MLIAGCRDDPMSEPPELGASPGEVRLLPRGAISPGMRVTMDVEADPEQGLSGGICFRLYKWDRGWGPEVDWMVNARTDESREVRDAEVACPAVGAPLPTNFTFTLPDLDDGTYRLTYDWSREGDESVGRLPEDGPDASYTFSVDT